MPERARWRLDGLRDDLAGGAVCAFRPRSGVLSRLFALKWGA